MTYAPRQTEESPVGEQHRFPEPREVTLGCCYAWHLGDQLCLTPLPRLLNLVYGTRVYVTDAPVNRVAFAHNPYVAGFREGHGLRVDRVARGSGHLIHRLQGAFGLRVDGVPRPEIYLSEEEHQWAARERARWPEDQPVCIMSTRAVSDGARYRDVDWAAVGEAWMRFCTVVQPVMTRPPVYRNENVDRSEGRRAGWRAERVVPGAVVYENLGIRQYMALFSVADYFCGATSGGSHVAAAFGLPSLIVVWRALLHEWRFPRSRLKVKKMFLYPQHDFIAAEDLSDGSLDHEGLDAAVGAVREHPPALPIGREDPLAGVSVVLRADQCLSSDDRRALARPCRNDRAGGHSRTVPGVHLVARSSRRLFRTRKGRIICVPGKLPRAARHPAGRRSVEHVDHLRERVGEALAADQSYPSEQFSGRGIVICAGARRYFTCAWVCVNMLRRLGCVLPIEVWHKGADEMTPAMKALLSPLGVEFADALELRGTQPARVLGGRELKLWAITQSRFQEVLCLDADTVPCVDPEALFDTPQYRETGAVFFPGIRGAMTDHRIWSACQIEYRDDPEFEMGHIVLDKARCWKALRVALCLAASIDFRQEGLRGPGVAFYLAWRKLGQPYAMPSQGIDALPGALCQHDFGGRRIFQHRDRHKWTLDGENPSIDGFLLDPECLALLDELRDKWHAAAVETAKPAAQSLYEAVSAQRRFVYVHVGRDYQVLEFLPDGRIAEDSGAFGKRWDVGETGGKPCLRIAGQTGVVAELARDDTECFRGQQSRPTGARVLLVPVRRGKP